MSYHWLSTKEIPNRCIYIGVFKPSIQLLYTYPTTHTTAAYTPPNIFIHLHYFEYLHPLTHIHRFIYPPPHSDDLGDNQPVSASPPMATLALLVAHGNDSHNYSRRAQARVATMLHALRALMLGVRAFGKARLSSSDAVVLMDVFRIMYVFVGPCM